MKILDIFKKDKGLYENIPLNNEKFLILNFDNLHNYPNLLDDMMNNKIIGIIIKGYISKEEIAYFFENYKSYPEDKKYKKAFGDTIGYVAHDSGESMLNYFERADSFKNDLKQLFGFDFYERFERYLSLLSSNKPLVHATHKNGEEYLGVNFKFMEPEYGGLIEHVGLAFYNLFPSLKYLESKIDTTSQLSYFSILQKPERGGELVLFDLKHGEENMDFETFADAKLLKMVRKKAIFKVMPEPGDMLVFNGGQVWHRVASIKGNKKRITVANFISYWEDRSKFIYWS